jgi:hypothetical protein
MPETCHLRGGGGAASFGSVKPCLRDREQSKAVYKLDQDPTD